jgi:hypothetical protein
MTMPLRASAAVTLVSNFTRAPFAPFVALLNPPQSSFDVSDLDRPQKYRRQTRNGSRNSRID